MLRSLLIDRSNWDDIAIIERDQAVSYCELADQAFAIRRSLPGSSKNVAIFLPNGGDYIAAFFAVLMSGLVAFPLNISLTRHEIAALLQQAAVGVVITSSKYRKVFEGIAGLHIVCAEVAYGAKIPYIPAAEGAIDEPAVLLSTSGTTGKSKIVQLSERNIVTSFLGYIDKMNFHPAENLRFILATPFSSAYGIMIFLACLTKSFPIVLTDGIFTLDAFYKAACTHKVTNYEGGTLTIEMMAHFIGRPIPYDISSVKCFGFGGSKMSTGILDELMKAYPDVGFFQGYGMTEAAPLITKHKRAKLEKIGSVGSGINGVQLAVAVDGVITHAPHIKGEILVKGPNIMVGYYQNEAETKKVIKNGYLYTGDIGYLDGEGYLYICGRKKNIIIIRGFNVYPEEIEACIMSSRLAEDCFVYGRSDRAGNERVCADILPANSQVRAADIMAWCAGHLADFKQPREINFCTAIRKNAAGKTERG